MHLSALSLHELGEETRLAAHASIRVYGGCHPGSRKVGFMVIGVYDLRASNTGPPGCQKSASITTVKVLDFTEQNRHLNLALKTHFGGTELVSKLPVSKALQTEQIS